MRSRIPDPDTRRAMILTSFLVLMLLVGCTSTAPVQTSDAALADRLEKLPTLPADIKSTLDPKTHATKRAGSPPLPVKPTEPLPLAPCCSIKQQMELTVNVPLTKCAPLWYFIVAPLSDLVMTREGGGGGGTPTGPHTAARGPAGNVRAYKLDTIDRVNVWNTWVCVTSPGPWDATFIEEHPCAGYGTQDSLYVSAWGDIVPYYWSGGAANHPTAITVATCNDDGTFRFPCGGLSNCPCESSPCLNPPCVCPAPW